MPQSIVIGHLGDGTEISVQVPTLAEYMAQHRPPPPLVVHEPEISQMSTVALEERYYELCEWYTGRLDYDPRCGCEEDGEGARCYWDDLDQIDEEIGRRSR